ncbi:hypothetical protein [Streptomyces sp. HB132]|uniref:hypothetical protein n=1 Tax=Streptomyces sp. HB132 TaxID=767388 RepID=UPI001961B174|nr:hypothetical protein [Streptomyces sp. HB132]MBM7441411.1 hypothetical protein [Streptomyces sp. HB132]
MHRSLAETARAALTAACAPGSDGDAALPAPRLGGDTTVVVADTCVRGDLGFVLLLHRRKDGLVAEELFFSRRENTGVWGAAEHLSGSGGIPDLTRPEEAAAVLRGWSLVALGDSETGILTERPRADEGHELVRFHVLLVNEAVGHLDLGNTSVGASPASGRVRKPLTSQVALIALFPEESVTVRTGAGAGVRPSDEPLELVGSDAASGAPWA